MRLEHPHTFRVPVNESLIRSISTGLVCTYCCVANLLAGCLGFHDTFRGIHVTATVTAALRLDSLWAVKKCFHISQ